MPYIKPEKRPVIDCLVEPILDNLDSMDEGDLNYLFSCILWERFLRNHRYATLNSNVGILECVKQEFYRRMGAPMEDEKIVENGDILPDNP
jgi:hypothetical protein